MPDDRGRQMNAAAARRDDIISMNNMSVDMFGGHRHNADRMDDHISADFSSDHQDD